MARSGFALGVLVGSLVGMAAGYALARNGEAPDSVPVAIDLTPGVSNRGIKTDAAGDTAPARPGRGSAAKE
ncbi:MAG: hypothetical protein ACYDGR_09055 [Candidatus Dormibacteria bacterium]